MTKVLISLVGHQPLPNLLAMRYLKPDVVMFVQSESKDPIFNRRKGYLETLAKQQGTTVLRASSPVDAWDLTSVPDLLMYDLLQIKGQTAQFLFDVTGGTKAMSIGLSRVAGHFGAQLIYLESEQTNTLLRRYHTTAGGQLQIIDDPQLLPSLATIDDFFYVHLGTTNTALHINQTATPHSQLFEQAVRTLLGSFCDEMKYSIVPMQNEEIDIVLRKRNRFAIVECKSGAKARTIEGVLQLNNLANEKHLGAYTQKILAVEVDYRKESENNAKVADEHNIHLLELSDWQEGKSWNDDQTRRFKTVIEQVFN